MTTYVAFLRAVNVGGHAVVKMTDLQDAFVAAGCGNVRTFIQSGNVVFDAPENTIDSLIEKVRGRLKRLLGHEPGIAVRTLGELEGLIRSAPFGKGKHDPLVKRYVAFLGEKPSKRPKFPLVSDKECLEATGMKNLDVFIVSRQKPNGWYGFPLAVIEKEILVLATVRNWTTVTKVVEFAAMKPASTALADVHAQLKKILRKYEKGALKGSDAPGTYTLIGPPSGKTGKNPVWLGCVKTGKNYVSYHFMPVYGSRELLDGISPALKKRMQGKACFNFTAVDEPLFKELAALTDRGYKRFKELKYIA